MPFGIGSKTSGTSEGETLQWIDRTKVEEAANDAPINAAAAMEGNIQDGAQKGGEEPQKFENDQQLYEAAFTRTFPMTAKMLATLWHLLQKYSNIVLGLVFLCFIFLGLLQLSMSIAFGCSHWLPFIYGGAIFAAMFSILAFAQIVMSVSGLQSIMHRHRTNRPGQLSDAQWERLGVILGVVVLQVVCVYYLYEVVGTFAVTSRTNYAYEKEGVDAVAIMVLLHARKAFFTTYIDHKCTATEAWDPLIECSNSDTWFADFVNRQCASSSCITSGSTTAECASKEVKDCMHVYSAGLGSPDGVACACETVVADHITNACLAIGAMAIVLVVVMCGALGPPFLGLLVRLRREARHAQRNPDSMRREQPIFMLLYGGKNVGKRQLIMACFLVPLALVAIAMYTDSLLTSTNLFEVEVSSALPVYIDSDQCEVVIETDANLPSGRLRLEVSLVAPRGIVHDNGTFVKFCSPAGKGLASHPLCDKPNPQQPELGLSAGCSNVTHLLLERQQRVGGELMTDEDVSHLCVMNMLDKTFSDTAYADWGCRVSLIGKRGETLPPVQLRSTEFMLHSSEKRVKLHDLEPELGHQASVLPLSSVFLFRSLSLIPLSSFFLRVRPSHLPSSTRQATWRTVEGPSSGKAANTTSATTTCSSQS
jgi:hypothetical protein